MAGKDLKHTKALERQGEDRDDFDLVLPTWFNALCILFLLIVCPTLCNTLTILTTNGINESYPKSLLGFFYYCKEGGAVKCLKEVTMYGLESGKMLLAAKVLLVWTFFAVLVYWWPAKTEYGPITDKGHKPAYLDNGMAHYFMSIAIFFGGNFLGQWELTILWDIFPAMISILNIFGLVFCVFLLIKGYYFPSTKDVKVTKLGVFADYYIGIELYPRIYDIDVKRFVNCRFSMTYWMLVGISFAYESRKNNGGNWDPAIVGCALSQFIYLTKFFYWEIGYMRSIDIVADNAGFYETWGCLVWVPTLYTLHTRVLVETPSAMTTTTGIIIFVISILGVGFNYWSDEQRMKFRATNGNCLIWGKKPRSIDCTYQVLNHKTQELEIRHSKLLASGWWGVSRHCQYIFELIAAWSWGIFAAYSEGVYAKHGIMVLIYPIFLTILLIHRAKRDEVKCLKKYGSAYEKYMEMVPYKIIPGVF